jgi:hypothetical protein
MCSDFDERASLQPPILRDAHRIIRTEPSDEPERQTMRSARTSTRVWCSFGKIWFPNDVGLLYLNVIQTSLLKDLSIIIVTLVFYKIALLELQAQFALFPTSQSQHSAFTYQTVLCEGTVKQ